MYPETLYELPGVRLRGTTSRISVVLSVTLAGSIKGVVFPRPKAPKPGWKDIVCIVSLATVYFIDCDAIKGAPILRMLALDKEHLGSADSHNVDATVV